MSGYPTTVRSSWSVSHVSSRGQNRFLNGSPRTLNLPRSNTVIRVMTECALAPRARPHGLLVLCTSPYILACHEEREKPQPVVLRYDMRFSDAPVLETLTEYLSTSRILPEFTDKAPNLTCLAINENIDYDRIIGDNGVSSSPAFSLRFSSSHWQSIPWQEKEKWYSVRYTILPSGIRLGIYTIGTSTVGKRPKITT
jgi:hypothetical protein